jgi:hypothetical protein
VVRIHPPQLIEGDGPIAFYRYRAVLHPDFEVPFVPVRSLRGPPPAACEAQTSPAPASLRQDADSTRKAPLCLTENVSCRSALVGLFRGPESTSREHQCLTRKRAAIKVAREARAAAARSVYSLTISSTIARRAVGRVVVSTAVRRRRATIKTRSRKAGRSNMAANTANSARKATHRDQKSENEKAERRKRCSCGSN